MLRVPRDRWRCLVVLALLGCASSPRASFDAPREAATTDESPVSLEEVQRAQRRASELALGAQRLARPERIHSPPPASDYAGRVACEIVSQWPLEQTLGLRFGPGVLPFAKFNNGMVRVVVPPFDEQPGALHVTTEHAGVVVRGVVNARELTLYPAAPARLGQNIVLGSRAPVALVRATRQGLVVHYELGASDSVTTTPDVARGSVACASIALEPGGAAADDGFDEEVVRFAGLEPSEHIPLAAVPGRPSVMLLRVGEGSCVPVLAEAGRATKVAILRTRDMLVGWIPSSALGPPDVLCQGRIGVRGHGVGTGTGQGFGTAPDGAATCPHDVPLDVKYAGKRQRVGFVRKGTPMILDVWGDRDVAVSVAKSTVRLVEDAAFVVEKPAFDGCKLKLVPKTPDGEHRPLPWPRRPVSAGQTTP